MNAMTAPDTFRLNAYRVLRIPASATALDIQKAAARMKQTASAGPMKTSEVDIPQLGDVPRGAADIDAAVCRLANPVHRLTDRLFWFCQLPAPSGAPRLSSAMDPTGHDSVLRALFQAMHGGLDESGLAAWADALSAWRALTCDDDYWYLTLIYEDQGGFESPATPEEVEALRTDAVRLAACPLLFATRTAFEAGEKDTIGRVLTALASLTHTGSWASVAIQELEEELVTPELDRCRELYVR
jgi:hypothetical protein